MKYWKLFWNNLNLGWKRIHYIIFFLLIIVHPILGFYYGDHVTLKQFMWWLLFCVIITILYLMVVSLVMWVIDGFKERD